MTTLPLATQIGSLDIIDLVLGAGPMAKLVLLVLAVFSVVSWGIIVERWLRFGRAEAESRAFLARFREGEGLATVHDATSELASSPLAAVYRAGFRELSLNPPPEAGRWEGEHLAGVDRMLRKSASVQLGSLERSLGFLATTASATPFIGLFGTVWGIMNAFRGIGLTGTASLAAYAPGIAEALVATAAGLAAAIPAVIAYNHFLGRLRGMDARLEQFIADFTHRIQGRRL